ncbi:MAG: amylo-alpha-1,6-glucosidase [Planctomycetota bacterium]
MGEATHTLDSKPAEVEGKHAAWVTHDLPFNPNNTDDVDRFLEREWLLTAGDGSYAMGTALGCNTRRYHGLFVAATEPPVGRVLALNQVFETLVLEQPDGATQRIEFSTCSFLDPTNQRTFAPQGFAHLERVTRGLDLTWHYRWCDLRWRRTLSLQRGRCLVRYTIDPFNEQLGRASLRLAPMLTLRDFHGLHDAKRVEVAFVDGDTAAFAGEAGRLNICVPGGEFERKADRWQDVWYEVDARRGQADREALDVPGLFRIACAPGKPVEVTASWAHDATRAESPSPKPRADRLDPIRKRISTLLRAAEVPDANGRIAASLAMASDDFVVARPVEFQGTTRELRTVIAGYPWFADWGRDTFIALPGLMLCTGRLEEALATLELFAGTLKNGVVPNRFDDANPGAMHFNTVDGSMWFIHAALEAAERLRLAQRDIPEWLGQTVCAVLDAHLAGTEATDHEHGQWRSVPITCGGDALLSAGDDHTQLTWMDAAVTLPDGTPAVFTPRPGKAVEVNALWFSNLAGAAAAAPMLGIDALRAQTYARTAENAGFSFLEVFWDDPHDRLRDHVRPDGTPSHQHRPNGVIAASLARSPLSLKQRRAVLDAAEAELLTPVGLRTLSPADRQYQPVYAGPQHERDAAYHQGTVWPWLIGAYAEGRLRAGGSNAKAKDIARAAITPLLERLTNPDHPDASLGQLHEIHEADADSGFHLPRGCPAQAWSVAELIRVVALLGWSPDR